MSDDRGLGDNAPPPDIDILREQVLEEAAQLRARRDEVLASLERTPEVVEDEETSGKVADLIKAMMACHKAAEIARVARKEPFLESGRVIDGCYKQITDPLMKAKERAERRLTLYQRQKAEEERRRREAEAKRQAEEAERMRAEAAARAASITTEKDLAEALTSEEMARQATGDAQKAAKQAGAKAAELSRTRGDRGAVASLRTFWDFTDLRRETLDLEALRHHIPLEGLEQAVRSFIKSGGRELTGVKIFENATTAVR